MSSGLVGRASNDWLLLLNQVTTANRLLASSQEGDDAFLGGIKQLLFQCIRHIAII